MRYKLDIDINIDHVLNDTSDDIVYEVPGQIDEDQIDNTKREFLRGAAAVGTLTIARL